MYLRDITAKRERCAWAELRGPSEAVPVWETLLDLYAARSWLARIDAYPAPVWGASFYALPDEVQDAHGRLWHIGSLRPHVRRFIRKRKPDPGMAIELLLEQDQDRDAVRIFGPYSIHVEVFGHTGGELFQLHDSGSSVLVWCEDVDPATVRAASGIPLAWSSGDDLREFIRRPH